MGPIQFGGRTIHVRQAAADWGFQPSYLSKVLSGKRDPDRLLVTSARTIAAHLGMSIEEFIDTVKARRRALESMSPHPPLTPDAPRGDHGAYLPP